MFLWRTPSPPARAVAIAVGAAVTVSIAADSREMLIATLPLTACTPPGLMFPHVSMSVADPLATKLVAAGDQ